MYVTVHGGQGSGIGGYTYYHEGHEGHEETEYKKISNIQQQKL
jgi:hypothetical protein